MEHKENPMTGILHIVLARKPIEGTIADNVLKHGTGALNIDKCRISTADWDAKEMLRANTPGSGRMKTGGVLQGTSTFSRSSSSGEMDTTIGRFPANLILDESDEVKHGFPTSVSIKGRSRKAIIKNQTRLNNSMEVFVNCEYDDSGSASRFFLNFTEQESDEFPLPSDTK